MPRAHVIDPSVVHHQWDTELEPKSELVIFENSSHTAFIEEQSSYLGAVGGFLARADAAAKAG